MIPDLQAALACEDVRMEVNGANTIVGVVNVITVPSVPFRIIKLCIYARWISGDGTFVQKTRILTPEDEKLVAETETVFKLAPENTHTTNIAIFTGLEFVQAGDYPIEIILDRDLKLRFLLRVIKIPPSPPNS